MADFRKVSCSNYYLMSVEGAEKSTNGTILFDYTEEHVFFSVVTDSRNAKAGSLFVPLRGERLDGHEFIEAALKNGAVCFFADSLFVLQNAKLVESFCKQYSACCIGVACTLKAFQDAAKSYLARFQDLYKVGITGSSGKTTTKEILASIFSQKYKTVCNEGNLNSETGLPLSVFEVRPYHEVGIFELGMNRSGEIAEITGVLEPNAAIITNIGTAHIGILGSEQAIAEEKKEIFSKFTDDCTGVIPECDFTDFLKEGVRGSFYVYSPYFCFPLEHVKAEGLRGYTLIYKGETVHFPLPGEHNLHNAAACIALAEKKGFTPAEIKAGLEAVKPLFGRSQVIEGEVTCFMDCYNANPESMSRAIAFCDSLETEGLKHYVLGSMLELGGKSCGFHEMLCRQALQSAADIVYFFGDEAAKAFEKVVNEEGIKLEHKKVYAFKTEEFEKLRGVLEKNIRINDFILLKGSRGLTLERLQPIVKVRG